MDSQTTALSSVGVLIEAVGRGSQVALKRLYELEARRLYGIALRIVQRPEVAADVLAFVDGLSHSEVAERVRAPLGSVKSWIRRGLLSLRRCLQR